jgi:renal tumor antigen
MEQNAYEWMKGRKNRYPEERVKVLIYQLVKALFALHKVGYFHRDIKPENLLISGEILKLADFGSCKGIYSKQPFTDYICTRWYRAPECLLTDGYYNYKADMWSLGCVFAEMLTLKPLFTGQNELEQVKQINSVLGSPSEGLVARFHSKGHCEALALPSVQGSGLSALLGNISTEALDLLSKLLVYNPDDRLSARQVLKHPYFSELVAAEAVPVLLPGKVEKEWEEGEDYLHRASDVPKAEFSNNTQSKGNGWKLLCWGEERAVTGLLVPKPRRYKQYR